MSKFLIGLCFQAFKVQTWFVRYRTNTGMSCSINLPYLTSIPVVTIHTVQYLVPYTCQCMCNIIVPDRPWVALCLSDLSLFTKYNIYWNLSIPTVV